VTNYSPSVVSESLSDHCALEILMSSLYTVVGN